METLKFTHLIENTSAGLYYSIDFDVPDGATRIDVSYSYRRVAADGGVNVVDLGLADADGRVLGWSGSARKSVFVSELDATPGYLNAKVKGGVWKILVGAYKIERGGVEVEYTVSFPCAKKELLFGDLHMHSTASDGRLTIAELVARARREGLDFISVTNHNNYAENLRLPSGEGVTLIPGVEWTHYKGHMNFYGVACPFTDTFVANTDAEMLRTVSQAKKLGAVVSVNHPKCTFCPYLWRDEGCFDMVEIWNGPMRRVNKNGIAWWTDMLRSGRTIPAVGGSDFHRNFHPFRFAHPVTAVVSDSRSADDILSAVAAGKSFITSSRRGARLYADCGGKSFGELARAGVLTYRVENAPLFASLSVVTDKGETAFRGKKAREGSVKLEGCSFAYLRLDSLGRTRAISNPIYFER